MQQSLLPAPDSAIAPSIDPPLADAARGLDIAETSPPLTAPSSDPPPTGGRPTRRWMPTRAVFTPAALAEPWGRQIRSRVAALGIPIQELRSNRVTGLRGENERGTYAAAKRTLAVVTAPPGQLKLQPIPPSADWQFHLAEGCPAHCQYCYLAGSLKVPPVVRAYANLPQILANLARYERPDAPTTYEASCYTDPLGIEHLTGSLAETIRYFGTRTNGYLRWVTKFDAVDDLLDLPHRGQTRCRVSLNAFPISQRAEGGTAHPEARLRALRRLALPRPRGGAAILSGSSSPRSCRSPTGSATTKSCSTRSAAPSTFPATSRSS